MLIEFFPKKIKRYAVIKEYAAVVQRIEVAGRMFGRSRREMVESGGE